MGDNGALEEQPDPIELMFVGERVAEGVSKSLMADWMTEDVVTVNGNSWRGGSTERSSASTTVNL